LLFFTPRRALRISSTTPFAFSSALAARLSLAPAAEAFAELLLKNNPLPPLWRAAK